MKLLQANELQENMKWRVEECREYWTTVAKKNGWYREDLPVQVWFNEKGHVIDSVSFMELQQDILILETE